eukprot:TRINITY_DN22838_c0_g1_i1.p1 TRINITY_DN22838_c0_g1~~TRINITY_DN22838_c0_g1_i1.p1  ORF type:complete len:663 (-),score=125.64 TRINITY_DN22838_c0_g1_i1:857-2845(-)
MDLNASPKPEDDDEVAQVEGMLDIEEDNEHEHDPDFSRHAMAMESGVEVLRREREERRKRMKREHKDEVKQVSKVPRYENRPSTTNRSIPEGWIDCPSAGQPLGNIIPSKVPLGESFNDCIGPGKRYSWKQVVHQQRALGREVAMVIDLTNTTRYYHQTDWTRSGIKYIKIACKGRDSVPDNESVMRFFHSCKQKNQNKFILVHCTHGHNRTGFMIVHYLVRTHGITVREALQRFATSRPPGIYKPDYIDALFRFYNERKTDQDICPSVPEWKLSGVDLNGNALADDDDDGDAKDGPQSVEEKGEMTNDDVLGDPIPLAHQIEMQKICCGALGVEHRGSSYFPGSQPVSLDRAHLQLLRQRYYYATWKADGTRYMMFITREGSYLIDRKFNFRRVQVRFPRSIIQQGVFESHHLTLLDGEMIIDRIPDGGKMRRYLVYDLIMVNSKPLIKLPFYERWRLINEELIEPRVLDRSNSSYCYEMEPFRVRRKDFWMLSTVDKLLRNFIPSLSHEADGLIFQGWDDPYIPRTHDGLLKWKYAHMNSVDFLFEVSDENRQSLYLQDKGRRRRLDGASVKFADDQDPSEFSGKIIECSWNVDEEVWEFMRVRPDKPHPNGWNTYMKVMQSISDNITEDVILEEISDIVRLPMYADRIRQEKAQAARRR